MHPNHIQAVTFDAGGTLFAPHPSVGHVYAEVATRHGIPCDVTKLNEGFARAWRDRAHFNYSRLAWHELVSSAFGPSAPVSTDLFNEIYDEFGEPRHWHVFQDVVPTLEALQETGLRLAVLSNWDERLPSLVEKLGLSSFFEFIIYSGSIGHHKPSIEIFRTTQERLGLAPYQILHVGDSAREDGEGARAAGWHSLVIRRDDTSQGLSEALKRVG